MVKCIGGSPSGDFCVDGEEGALGGGHHIARQYQLLVGVIPPCIHSLLSQAAHWNHASCLSLVSHAGLKLEAHLWSQGQENAAHGQVDGDLTCTRSALHDCSSSNTAGHSPAYVKHDPQQIGYLRTAPVWRKGSGSKPGQAAQRGR